MRKIKKAMFLINLTGEPFNVYDGLGNIITLEPELPKEWMSSGNGGDLYPDTYFVVRDEDLGRAKQKLRKLAVVGESGTGRGGVSVRKVFAVDDGGIIDLMSTNDIEYAVMRMA